jgi:hypothetical protein
MDDPTKSSSPFVPASVATGVFTPSPDAVRTLKENAATLDVEEILSLCYARNDDPVRLIVYVDALRMKGGARAQAAACLVCFDLARRGFGQAERDFMALVPVMVEFIARAGTRLPRAVDEIVEESDYLRALLRDLEERLKTADPRTELAGIEDISIDDGDAIEISLLDDDDFDDLGLEGSLFNEDRARMMAAWDDALSRFLGAPGDSSSFGFSTVNRASLLKVERLREEASSYAAHVPAAAELLPLIELFLASHQRAKNLFGRRNKARDQLMVAGLAHFTALTAPPVTGGAWFDPPTAGPFAFEKLAEILLDYVAFLGSLPAKSAPIDMPVQGFADAYAVAERPQPPPARLAKDDRRRR